MITIPCIVLLAPLLLARYLPLFLINKVSLGRAAFFAPSEGGEKAAYLIYQLSSAALLVVPCFYSIKTSPPWFYIGLAVYAIGILLMTVSTVNFAIPSPSGINTNGICRFSRNPIYLAFFLCFLGYSFIAQSLVLLGIVIVFQISSHWIILSEERWCIEQFGDEYIEYMKKTGRYF